MSSRCFLETASHGSKTAKPHAALQADHFFVQKPSGKIAMMQGKNPGPDAKHYSLHNSPDFTNQSQMKKLHHSPFTITKTQRLTPGSAPIGYAQIGLSASDVDKLESPEDWRHTELHVLPEVSAAKNWLMVPPLAAMQTKDQI